MSQPISARRWPRAAYVVLHAVSGVYAGGCVCVAAVDLAVVRSLGDGARSLELLQLMLPAMGRLMAPQLGIMLLLVSALTWRVRGRIAFSWVPLALLAAIVTITWLVHIPLNQRIIAGRVELSEVHALIGRWASFHTLRTVLALSLPYAVVRCLRKASLTPHPAYAQPLTPAT